MDAKALQENIKSLGFTSHLASPEIVEEVGRQRTCLGWETKGQGEMSQGDS